MEQSSDAKPLTKPIKKVSATAKFEKENFKLLNQLKEKANKKTFGRRIKSMELIMLGLSLIGDDHLKDLQEKSRSEKDFIDEAFEKYVKSHGKIAKDEFIAKIIRQEITL